MKLFVIVLIILLSTVDVLTDRIQSAKLGIYKPDVDHNSCQSDQQNRPQPASNQPRYDIIKEDCDEPPSRSCKALLMTTKKWFSEKYYSIIFDDYSRRFPNKEDSLSAYLYIDEEYRSNRQFINELHFSLSLDRGAVTSNIPMSIYYHRNRLDHITPNEVTEYYSYQNQDSLSDRIVILRGSILSRSKEMIGAVESALDELKVRIISYKLHGVTPDETYYTVESYSEDLRRWRGVISIQSNQRTLLSKNNIVLLSKNIAFVFIGWKYSVTTDGGKTWHKWDGESELPNWKCCASDLIQRVIMSPDGNGAMTLRFKPNSSLEVMQLRTQNYGKSWKAD